MSDLLMLIYETEDDFLQAEQQELKSIMDNDMMHLWYEGYKLACKKHIEKLTLLLNAETQTTVKKPEA